MKSFNIKKFNFLYFWLPILGSLFAILYIFNSEFENEKNYFNMKLHRQLDEILRDNEIENHNHEEFPVSIFYENYEHKNLEIDPLNLSQELTKELEKFPTDANLEYFGAYAYLSKKTPTRSLMIVLRKNDLHLAIMKKMQVTYLVVFVIILLCTINAIILKRLQLQNQELLAESKKLSAAQSIAKLGAWEFIISTKTFIWGDGTFRIFEMDPQKDTEPTLSEFFAMATKESRAKVEDSFKTVLNKGASHQTVISIITPKGNKKYLLSRAETILEANGKIERVFGTSIDITEKKKLEEEIAIERQKKSEDNRMAAIGELSSTIAHEINNPMTIISGQASLLKMKLQEDDIDKESMIERCEKIEETIHRMGQIINGLRVLSRRSQFDEFAPTPLKEVIQSVLYFVGPRLKKERINFEIDEYDDEELAILARPVEISQVILNLINNAIDAVMNLENKWLHINIKETDDKVILKIQDSGTISDEIKERILKDSFTTKPIGKGTGIGLIVSKRIIAAHNGTLEFIKDSPTTTFIITLPKTEIIIV